MASNLEECGYDEFFTTEVPDELKCVICHLVLRKPVQLMACGHRFCSPCFNRMKVSAEGTNTELTCPVDREAVLHGHVFPDKAASRTIGNLKVQCGNRDQGCSWVDDLRDLKDHEESCQFKIVVGMEEMSVKSGRDEELDKVIKQILFRLQSCENDALKKDKDLSNLRFVVGELKDNNKEKEEEMQMLKLSIEELKTDVVKKDNEIEKLNGKIDLLSKDFLSAKQSTEQNLQNLNQLQSSTSKEINQSERLQNHIETTKRDIEKKIEQNNLKIDQCTQSIETLNKTVENLECALFAQPNITDEKTIKFNWVMQDYLRLFRIGDAVFSPIFHPKIGGYSFQLYLKWEGPNRGKMNLYLELHRGKTPHRFLKDFDYGLTLALYDKNGVPMEGRYDRAEIQKFKEAFRIKKGYDATDKHAGTRLLTAPYDNYIINNSLLFSLTVHI